MIKIYIVFLLVLSSQCVLSQTSRNWTAFSQTVEVSTEKERSFVLSGHVKVKIVAGDSVAGAGLWARVDTKDGEPGFFDNMGDRRIQDSSWKEYHIKGTINKNSKALVIGGLVALNGDFYFDELHLEIEDDAGNMQKIALGNQGFEEVVVKEEMDSWNEGIRKTSTVSIKEYTIQSSNDAVKGSYSLLLEGTGIAPVFDYRRIKEKKGFTPQVGTLVSMLDNLKERASFQTKNLTDYQTDHLHDEEANSIGALIMHLAAAEVYYQVLTFENRRFNEEEKEKWGAAFDLGEEGRKAFRDKPISYYLEEFDKVRERTKELLATVDDDWLQAEVKGAGMNNYYGWFHVMEHQSSHLGQILFLKKRIPPEPTIENREEVKD